MHCCSAAKNLENILMKEKSNNSADLIDLIYEKILEARYCTAFTGAGISTLSGIPDFRGKDGIYKNPGLSEKIFDLKYFLIDPKIFYEGASSLIYKLDEKTPSIVHLVLSKLERKSMLKALITQNIDLLHQKAGSKNILEIHGSPETHYCLNCNGVSLSYDEASAIINRGEMPQCPKCGKILKPAITFFGENLPEKAMNEAIRHAELTDLMLVLGTSLSVFPAASIPQICLKNGGEIIIVNNMHTFLDEYAIIHCEDLEIVFERLKQLI